MTSEVLPVQPAAGSRMRVGVLGAGMIATIGYGYLPHLGIVSHQSDSGVDSRLTATW